MREVIHRVIVATGEWRWRRRSVKWTASQCEGLIWAMCRRGKWMRIKRTGSRIQSPHRHSLISQMNFILPARPVANRLLFPAAFARRTLNVAGACLLSPCQVMRSCIIPSGIEADTRNY